MTNPLQVKSIIDPDLNLVLQNLKLDIFSTLNCVKIGSIQSFDVTKKTAQVQILFKWTLPTGTTQSQPVLVDVPVFTLQGGGGAIQFPIQAGDQCLILFSDRRIDEWFQNGAEVVPGDPRMHDLSDGIALVGLNALNSKLPPYPTDQVVLSYQGTNLALTSDGYTITAEGGAEFDINDTIDLTAADGAEITLGTLVSIKNSATSLLTCVTDLINVLSTLTVTVSGTSGIVSAATIAALVTVQDTLNTLLE